jgi:hypothetical protein
MADETFKSKFGTIGCYVENFGEFMQEFEENHVNDDGKVVTLKINSILDLMQETVNKYKESKLECEGKEVEIDFGDGAVATLLENLLRALGFEL